MIRFRCGNCEKGIKALNEDRGKTVKCPRCGETVQVPFTSVVPDKSAGETKGQPPPLSTGRRESPAVRPDLSPMPNWLQAGEVTDSTRQTGPNYADFDLTHATGFITATCPTCAAKVQAPDALAGQPAKCPRCGASIRVPRAERSDHGITLPEWVPHRTEAAEPPAARPKASPPMESVTLEMADEDAPLGPQPPEPSAAERARQWFACRSWSFYIYTVLALVTTPLVLVLLRSKSEDARLYAFFGLVLLFILCLICLCAWLVVRLTTRGDEADEDEDDEEDDEEEEDEDDEDEDEDDEDDESLERYAQQGVKKKKACPFCGEEILALAILCKHCHQPLRKTAKRRSRSKRRGFRCPYCRSKEVPETRSKISAAGWVTFVVLLLFCLPLFWIGLLIKEEYHECAECGMKIGG